VPFSRSNETGTAVLILRHLKITPSNTPKLCLYAEQPALTLLWGYGSRLLDTPGPVSSTAL